MMRGIAEKFKFNMDKLDFFLIRQHLTHNANDLGNSSINYTYIFYAL